MRLIEKLVIASVALISVNVAANAQPVNLAPGGVVSPVPEAGFATIGTQVGATLTSPFSGVNGTQAISGTVISAAFDRDAGPGQLLDFWYQVVVNPSGAGSNSTVTGLNLASFIGFTTDVGQTADGDGAGPIFSSGAVAAANAIRSGDGEGIQFNFTAPVGSTTFTFLVRTNGVTAVTGNAGILASGVGANAQALAPALPQLAAPEPATFGLLALGTVAFGLAARRKRVS